jgi:F-type H+-transporting ATPase subunit delta
MNSSRRTRQAARELFRYCVVDGALDVERVRLVAAKLAASTRRGALPVLAAFHRLVRLDSRKYAAIVESAVPLPPDIREDLCSRLARTYGSGIEPSFSENPELLGGIRVTVGSDVYDGSVRARLALVRSRF